MSSTLRDYGCRTLETFIAMHQCKLTEPEAWA